MALLFTLKDGEKIRTRKAEKASATVIAAGSFVGIDAGGLIITAVAGTTALAYCINGAAAGTTDVEVTTGNDFTLVGTASVVFAKASRGLACDLTAAQLINTAATATSVVKVGISPEAGTVGVAAGVEVRINKPLF